MNVHGFLHPSVLRKATATSPLEELEFLFDTPSDAEEAILEILEVEMEFTTPAPAAKLLLTVKGKVAKGVFVPDTAPTPPPAPPAGEQNLLVRIRGAKQSTGVGPYLIPLNAKIGSWSTEGGVAEIVSKFSCKEKKADATATVHQTKTAILVRQTDLKPRDRITGGLFAVINGSDNPTSYFGRAEAYWKGRADKVSKPAARSLNVLRTLMAPATDAEPWSEVSIVVHGTKTQMRASFDNPRKPNQNYKGALDPFLLADEHKLGGVGPTAGVLARTRVVLRGCNIGRNMELMQRIKQFLGCAELVAPKYLQNYLDLAGNVRAEGLGMRLFVYKPVITMVKERGGKNVPTVKLSDLAAGLHLRYKTGTDFLKELQVICPEFPAAPSASDWETLVSHSDAISGNFGHEHLAITESKTIYEPIPWALLTSLVARHGTSLSILKPKVEEAFQELWLDRNHPHATSTDFDTLSFGWQQPTDLEWEFSLEDSSGTIQAIEPLRLPDWHLLYPVFTADLLKEINATVQKFKDHQKAINDQQIKINNLQRKINDATNPAVLAKLESDKAKEEAKLETLKNWTKPDVKFSAFQAERFDWYMMTYKAISSCKRRIAVEIRPTWNSMTDFVKIEAKATYVEANVQGQDKAGKLLAFESFRPDFFSVV